MKIVKTKLPSLSILNKETIKYDYIDSFSTQILDTENKLTSCDVGKSFFSSSPKWVDKLFMIRNKIVKVFGLKTSGNILKEERQLQNFKFEQGEQFGLFKVFAKTNNEIILGEDDQHLNFRISLHLEDIVEKPFLKCITISTTVVFNNWFGRIYFIPVKIFHRLIVPAILRAMVKELELNSINKKK